MFKSLNTYFLFIIVQNYASSIGHFGHLDLKSYSDPRFLNSDYEFKGLGLFHPNTGGLESYSETSEGTKGINEDEFGLKHGFSGGDVQRGLIDGFKDEGDVKDAKEENGYFFNSDDGKKEHLDGKEYYGKKHFGNEDKSRDEKDIKQGHRKGHKIKGFSNSHHNDESDKTEEFYDDEHDEAEDEGFAGKFGVFGDDLSSAFKGGHEVGEFTSGDFKTGVIFNKGEAVKKIHKDEGNRGESKFDQKGNSFGGHKRIGEKELSEFGENSKFIKNGPEFYF